MRWLSLAGLLGVGAILSGVALAQSSESDADDGAKIYAGTCAACHGGQAEGVPGSYPRLRGRVHDIAASAQGRKYLMSVVSFGMFGSIEVDDASIFGVMPPHPQLADADIAAVLNYLDGLETKDDERPFTAKRVGGIRAHRMSPQQVHDLRAKALDKGTSESAAASPAYDKPSGRKQARLKDLRARVAAYGTQAKTDFQLHCAGCHGFDGVSPTPHVPTLRNVAGYFPHMKRGREFLVRVPGVAMSMLDDAQTAQVLNWLLLAFSPDQLPDDFQPYTVAEVHDLRAHPLTTQSDPTRARIVAALAERGVTASH